MESFWQTIVDFIILFLKACVVFLALRLILMILQIDVFVPFFDDLLLGFWDIVTRALPKVGNGFSL